MAVITLLKTALGLNNVVDPTRLKHNFETGETELAIAYNVDIDAAGRVSRRKGFTVTARTEATHSLFCDGGECLFVSGSVLYRLNADYSRTGVRSGLTGGIKCRYCQVADNIYYSNYQQNGYVKNGINYPWAAADYVGPVTTRRFSDPPLAEHFELHSSRLYLSAGNVLWYTEPFAYNWCDLARNFVPLRSRICMIRSVKTGLFVGTETEVIFLGGMTPDKFEYSVVSSGVVIEDTDVKVPGSAVAGGDATDQFAMWTANDGIYIGFPDGSARNVTRDKLTYPTANAGCAVFNNNKYLTLFE